MTQTVFVAEIFEILNTTELAQAKLRGEEESKATKIGYERVKEKAKGIKQNYQKAEIIFELRGGHQNSSRINLQHD